MPEVYRTTAEHIVGVTDAALQCTDGIDAQIAENFLDTPPASAIAALQMAVELGLLKVNPNGRYIAQIPTACYLACTSSDCRAAVLRFVLEQFAPYRTFKQRLAMNEGDVRQAALQTRALHQMTAHRDDVVSVFIDLGTYANSITTEAAGRYTPKVDENPEFLTVLEQVIQDRETAELAVRRRIGEEAAQWCDDVSVISNLVTAYQRAAVAETDPKAPIVHAGNAIESFLVQLATHHQHTLTNATGINSKADQLGNGGYLKDKHKFMIKYIGHIRNAAEHGVDPSIGAAWEVSTQTAIEHVYVAQSVIRSVVADLHGRFEV